MCIKTKNDYWEVINDVDRTCLRGKLVCEIFTKDLCEVQRTDSFLKQFELLAAHEKV
ncbi:hypothetical protein CI610_02519 [invertebrate metagenome]|uniref:Uncharacterized protein n=1 Tax=invertebrate metagenome TaxID=1711999 RepID=A0A2H9T5S0_9ZZZZ